MTIEQAHAEAVSRWGKGAQVVETWREGVGQYVVGVSFAGESAFFPAIAGGGETWEAAFLDADKRLHPAYFVRPE